MIRRMSGNGADAAGVAPRRPRDHLRALRRREVVGDERVRGRGLLLRRQPAGGDDPLARRAVHARGLEGRARRRRVATRAAASTSTALASVIDELDAAGVAHRVLFLERRRADAAHPLQGDAPPPPAGAARQRGRRHPPPSASCSRRCASAPTSCIDTTGLSAPALRRKVADELLEPEQRPAGSRSRSASFGHKHGPPRDADLAFDVRFLPNPHYEPELRPLTGLRPADRRLRRPRRPRCEEFYDHVLPLLEYLLPAVRRRGQGAPRGRDRLHRRPPPLGRDRRAPRRSASATRRATSSRSQHRDVDRRRRTRAVAAPLIASPALRTPHRKGSDDMPVRVGINGFGRIGRNVFRAAHEARRGHRDRRRQRHHRRRRRSRTCSSTTRSSARSRARSSTRDDAHRRRRPARSRCSPSATRPRCRGATSASTS